MPYVYKHIAKQLQHLIVQNRRWRDKTVKVVMVTSIIQITVQRKPFLLGKTCPVQQGM